MEATGDYWNPLYYLFEDVLSVMLVNAQADRKPTCPTPRGLSNGGPHGLLRTCFVPPPPPPPPIRVLSDLTRARTIATQDRTSEIQRLEKFLESAGLKLSDDVSDQMGVSSRAMPESLISILDR